MKDFNKAAGFQVPQIDTGFFTNTNLSWLSILKNTIEERFSHNNIDKEGAFWLLLLSWVTMGEAPAADFEFLFTQL